MASTSSHATGEEETGGKLIHFTSGETMYEDELVAEPAPVSLWTNWKAERINSTSLTWPSWFLFYSFGLAYGVLEVCDRAGDKLASFFGITSPKYAFEVRTQQRLDEMEKEFDDCEEVEETTMETNRQEKQTIKAAETDSSAVRSAAKLNNKVTINFSDPPVLADGQVSSQFSIQPEMTADSFHMAVPRSSPDSRY